MAARRDTRRETTERTSIRRATCPHVDREEVRELVGRGAVLVEVLPSDEYEHEHIAGAINVPLREIEREAPERIRPDETVIVYCNDYQ